MQNAKCKMQNVKCRGAARVSAARETTRRTLHFSFCIDHFAFCIPDRARRGFTLIELLVAITIIGILAGLILGVASVAGETARHRKTEQMIARLHTLLMEHYDTYKTRRVSVRQQIIDGINASTHPDYNTPAEKGRALAYARLYALRELILMEVPDRWSDILLNDVPDDPAAGVQAGRVQYALLPFFQDASQASPISGRTGLADVYLRRYAAIATRDNSITGEPNTGEEITDNQGAECLFLVITLATGEGEARSLFGESTIGDTDGDGAYEFLDGWDRPINFLRWAPGFDSQIQLSAHRLNPPPSGPPLQSNQVWLSAANADHDPFDVYRVDAPAFRLVPLIFSAGGDETFGVRLVKPHVALRGLEANQLAIVPNPNNWRIILPYGLSEPDEDDERVYLGTDGEGATDNIHNHLLGDR
jgi:prepilin-type N-terminal cleavage/methylation domain-containing protein